MRTRKELVEAYLFVTRRIVSAMMSTNPDALELPMRRSRYSILGGALLSLLIFAGFWVVGMFMPMGNQTWKQDGHIVLNTDTGTVYVFMQDVLYPVKNMASAKLIASDESVTQVENADLEGVDRGWELGIEGAPAFIPSPDSLVGMPWQVCSAPDAYDNTQRVSHIVVSVPPVDAAVGERAVVVSSGDRQYLLWNEHKHLVEEDAALMAMGLNTGPVVPVSPVFTSAVDDGPDLIAPEIAEAGEDAGEIAGVEAEYGDFFTVGGQDYVLTPIGFAPIGEVGSALLTEGETQGSRQIKASDIEEVGLTSVEPFGFPQEIPELAPAEPDSVVCAVAKDDQAITIALHNEPPQAIQDPKVFNPVNENDETDTADHFWLPGGKGALIREVGAPDALDGTIYLITEQGTKYALAGDAMSKLGFADVTPTPVPASLVALVPTGPALDPETVHKQVPFEIK